jgi:class 3 adenylate cyclase
MTFDDILEQAIAILQRRGRVTYRTLKRQFDLDDDALEDLKDELLFSQPVVDEARRGLLWTGDPAAPAPDTQRRTEVERRFHAMLSAVMWWLQRDGRVTYRTIKHVLGLDDVLLEDIRKDLAFRRLAIDEDGIGLVWAGEAQPAGRPAEAMPRPPATADPMTVVSSPTAPTLPPSATETRMASHEPTGPAEAISTEALPDDESVAQESTRIAPDAERRHLTVMFCDLVDSTTLSQQLDPEDLREVIRAYHQTSADVIHHYDGTIAQHLGDGLLIYFGWPVAHEDDAQRALHAGLGLVEALTTRLNPHLEHEHGVQLAVRIGIHTGPVVVGEMGGGKRQEHLATGDTVNIASRLEGLATPNTVVMSHVTARLVQGTFALEDLGAHAIESGKG